MKRTAAIIVTLLAVLAAGFAASYATATASCVPHAGQHCKQQTTSTSPTTTTGTTSTTTTGLGGDVNQSTTWNCTTAMAGQNVTVTIGPGGSGDAVVLRAGCTGYIASITVVQYHGDGLKIDAASNLEIGRIDVRCYAHTPLKHQDGVQVLGSGQNVQIDGGYVGCYSANNSQTWINPATSNGSGAQNVVFHHVNYDPAGAESGAPLYTYGAGGAYGLANMTSTDSGFADSALISQPNHHPCVTGSGAVRPVWTGTTFPAGDACP